VRGNELKQSDLKQSGLVQGTLDMLILKTLALGPMHGYGIGVRIEQISKGVFQVNAGSLFPAIRRVERDGLIAGEWGATENNRRAKYYALTTQGRAALKRETRDWEVQLAAITRILKASPTEA
jgi:PadR family transcriptional regulator, regulatory protein PadR